jgi:hypothetical protein
MGIPNEGLVELCGLAGDSGSPTEFTYLATGQGDTAFAITDSALEDEIVNADSLGLKRVVATVTKEDTNITDDTLQLTTTFTVVGTTTIKEVGVTNHATKGHANERWLSRTVLTTPKDVVSGSSYTLTYKIIFTRA